MLVILDEKVILDFFFKYRLSCQSFISPSGKRKKKAHEHPLCALNCPVMKHILHWPQQWTRNQNPYNY